MKIFKNIQNTSMQNKTKDKNNRISKKTTSSKNLYIKKMQELMAIDQNHIQQQPKKVDLKCRQKQKKGVKNKKQQLISNRIRSKNCRNRKFQYKNLLEYKVGQLQSNIMAIQSQNQLDFAESINFQNINEQKQALTLRYSYRKQLQKCIQNKINTNEVLNVISSYQHNLGINNIQNQQKYYKIGDSFNQNIYPKHIEYLIQNIYSQNNQLELDISDIQSLLLAQQNYKHLISQVINLQQIIMQNDQLLRNIYDNQISDFEPFYIARIQHIENSQEINSYKNKYKCHKTEMQSRKQKHNIEQLTSQKDIQNSDSPRQNQKFVQNILTPQTKSYAISDQQLEQNINQDKCDIFGQTKSEVSTFQKMNKNQMMYTIQGLLQQHLKYEHLEKGKKE